MDLDAIQQMVFLESEEGLQALESCFALCREGADDGETINTIFRAVHSIKGGAGAFGHEQLQTFAHHYESVLDQLRSGGLAMLKRLQGKAAPRPAQAGPFDFDETDIHIGKGLTPSLNLIAVMRKAGA